MNRRGQLTYDFSVSIGVVAITTGIYLRFGGAVAAMTAGALLIASTAAANGANARRRPDDPGRGRVVRRRRAAIRALLRAPAYANHYRDRIAVQNRSEELPLGN